MFSTEKDFKLLEEWLVKCLLTIKGRISMWELNIKWEMKNLARFTCDPRCHRWSRNLSAIFFEYVVRYFYSYVTVGKLRHTIGWESWKLPAKSNEAEPWQTNVDIRVMWQGANRAWVVCRTAACWNLNYSSSGFCHPLQRPYLGGELANSVCYHWSYNLPTKHDTLVSLKIITTNSESDRTRTCMYVRMYIQ